MTATSQRPDPGRSRTLVVFGSGSLARAVCYALAEVATLPTGVVVVARSVAKAAEVCHVAAVRSALAGRPVTFQPAMWDSTDADGTAELLAGIPLRSGPGRIPVGSGAGGIVLAGVVLCASTQSPWERLRAPSPWTALLDRAGFGLTLPLHAELALAVSRAVAQACPGAWFINACFPDAVNALLAASGAPVLCGIGNVALLAAGLQAALGLPDQRRLRVLAHHVHLHQPDDPEDEALAWCDDAPVEGVGKLLAAQRATSRPELNQITGYAAALLLRDLLAGAETATSLPGPLGLPGGYPVRLRGDRLTLRLPPGLPQADAVAINQRAALRDGVAVQGGRVVFGPAARAELRRVTPELVDGFDVTDVTAVAQHLHRLRGRLRT